jgi:hypothetical protein
MRLCEPQGMGGAGAIVAPGWRAGTGVCEPSMRVSVALTTVSLRPPMIVPRSTVKLVPGTVITMALRFRPRSGRVVLMSGAPPPISPTSGLSLPSVYRGAPPSARAHVGMMDAHPPIPGHVRAAGTCMVYREHGREVEGEAHAVACVGPQPQAAHGGRGQVQLILSQRAVRPRPAQPNRLAPLSSEHTRGCGHVDARPAPARGPYR